jgi:hypothetical protein
MYLFLLLILILAVVAGGFQFTRSPSCRSTTTSLGDFKDFMANLDDTIDDFLNKRMGNGEIFYGQRKSSPSNRPNTKGKYNGMGLSDKTKIDVTRIVKEEIKARKKQERQN